MILYKLYITNQRGIASLNLKGLFIKFLSPLPPPRLSCPDLHGFGSSDRINPVSKALTLRVSAKNKGSSHCIAIDT